jgi:membrane-bound lytic murein transglycosylase A
MADRLVPAQFSALTGFETDQHFPALRHMLEVLEVQLKRKPALGPAPLAAEAIKAWEGIAAAATEPANEREAKLFFRQHFELWRVIDEARPAGLFTGYFEPDLKGSRTASPDFSYPVFAKPADFVQFNDRDKARAGTAYGKWQGSDPVAYDTREDIDRGSLKERARVICHVADPVELFFMHIQGSGRITLDTGESLRLGYAGKSGHSYQSIGAILVREGLLVRENVSMESIKQWIKDNPQRRDWLLWQNPSYVFFQELDLPDPSRGALGAAGIQLIPERSLAIDKTRYAYGTPVFLSTSLPTGASFKKLMIAADTGSAILGAARGDVYFGWGERAEYLAGHMKQPGELHVLLPKLS